MQTTRAQAHAASPPRPVRDGDAQDLFGLLALCFAEYPGCYLDPHDDLADLLAPETILSRPGLSRSGAAFWVVEDEAGRVCACIAVDCPQPGLAELHRLYVRPDRRRGGLARQLVQLAEEHARAAGATRMMLWSDTRFCAAHSLYERLGYRRIGSPRALGDISASQEHAYERALGEASPG